MNLKIKLAAAALVLSVAAIPAQAQQTASDTASSAATIIRPITVTKNEDLNFGTLVRAEGTVTVSNAGTRSATGSIEQLSAGTGTRKVSNAQFTIDGEGGQAITVTVPATFTLTNQTTSGELTVTTSNDMSGAADAQALSNALGADGSKVVKVGGSFPLTTSTSTGNYTGSFTVTAAYN